MSLLYVIKVKASNVTLKNNYDSKPNESDP